MTWTPAMVATLVALVLALSGCGTPRDDPAGPPAASEQQETRRGPVSLEASQPSLVLPSELAVDVPSCNGDPELTRLIEDPDAIRLEVVTTQVVRGDDAACLDGLAIVLEQPLGDREVIDLVSGASLRVVDQTEILECTDIDYPLEPTFDTPDEALADALRDRPSSGTVPGRVEDYVRDDREGQVFFEHIVDDHDVLFTWGVVQDDDGRWGVVSLGGCF
jgi:hypothetical protein